MGTTNKAGAILKFNNDIRGSSEPTDTDAAKLWSWYSSTGLDASAKASATTFLKNVETEQMVHSSMLIDFKTNLDLALKQDTTANNFVAADAKNYAAIVGGVAPTVDTTCSSGTCTGTGIRNAAKLAYDQLQLMSAANKATAKASAEARLYGSWLLRFKKLRDTDGIFSGTNGFKYITKCLRETVQSTNPGDDSQGGTSGWAVYARVSSAMKKKMRDLIVAQVTANTAAL